MRLRTRLSAITILGQIDAMSMRNTDHEDKLRFRSERIACQNGLFYFTTREGTLEGPYRTHDQAEVAAALYIRYHLDPTKLESLKHEPDPHIYRYTERGVLDRREDNDRREQDRRVTERRRSES